MTVDKTKARATNRNELVERTRDRIILEHTESSNHSHQSRKPPGIEGKCMRCGKPEHQLGQKCPAKNAKLQGLSQNRTLPQGMPVQKKDQES